MTEESTSTIDHVDNGAGSRAEAKRLLEIDRSARMKRAQEKIQSILQEQHCQLVAVPSFVPTDNGRFSIAATVQLVALDVD